MIGQSGCTLWASRGEAHALASRVCHVPAALGRLTLGVCSAHQGAGAECYGTGVATQVTPAEVTPPPTVSAEQKQESQPKKKSGAKKKATAKKGKRAKK